MSTVLHVPNATQALYADERVKRATAAAAAAGKAEANALCRVVAQLIRQVLPDAATLVFNKDINDDDHTEITPLLIRDRAGALLWFSRFNADDHPDAIALMDSGKPRRRMRGGLLRAIREGLEGAYDAAEGHFECSDEEVGSYGNLLELHIGAALAADQPGAAATFDREAFRAWCAAPHSSGHGTNGEYVLGGEYDSFRDDPGSLAEDLLHDSDFPAVLTYAPEVSAVTVWRTADGDGVDGGVLVEVTVDGVNLSERLADGDLVYGEPDDDGRFKLPEVEAVELVLGAIAGAVDQAVAKFRGVTGRAHVEQVPQLRGGEVWGPVTLGFDGLGGDVWRAVYDPHERWNGWLCPRFRRDEAELMRLYFEAGAARSPEMTEMDTLRWDGDVLVMVSGQYNRDGGMLEPGQEPDEDRIEPDERGLYAIGGYSWCWSAAREVPAVAGDAPAAGQQRYLDADADHKPVPDKDGEHYECGACGLATVADGSRHGHVEEADTYENFVGWCAGRAGGPLTIADAARAFSDTPLGTLVQWWARERPTAGA